MMGSDGSRLSRYVLVDIAQQRLCCVEGDAVRIEAPVSTAKNGAGECLGSGCTPRGWHRIRARIGGGRPVNSVFVGRRPTGEVYSLSMARTQAARDWILTRILWLGGLEKGVNRYGDVDTQRRYIYIHGCPDDYPMGLPASHGCIRMRNTPLLDVFDWTRPGDRVLITEDLAGCHESGEVPGVLSLAGIGS